VANPKWIDVVNRHLEEGRRSEALESLTRQLSSVAPNKIWQRARLFELLVLLSDQTDAVRWFDELSRLPASRGAISRCLNSGSALCKRLLRAGKLRDARRISNWMITQEVPVRYTGILEVLAVYAIARKKLDRSLHNTLDARLRVASRRFGISLDAPLSELSLRDRIVAVHASYRAGAQRFQSLLTRELATAQAGRKQLLMEYIASEPVGYFRSLAKELAVRTTDPSDQRL